MMGNFGAVVIGENEKNAHEEASFDNDVYRLANSKENARGREQLHDDCAEALVLLDVLCLHHERTRQHTLQHYSVSLIRIPYHVSQFIPRMEDLQRVCVPRSGKHG